jgi:hypothetical protein
MALNNNPDDNIIKDFIDASFGGNALDIIKYKYPKLNQSLNQLAESYDLFDLDNNLDELELKIAIAQNAYKITNLDKKKDELNGIEEDVKQVIDAKKRLANKKEHLNRLMKKGMLFN